MVLEGSTGSSGTDIEPPLQFGDTFQVELQSNNSHGLERSGGVGIDLTPGDTIETERNNAYGVEIEGRRYNTYENILEYI